MKKGLIRTALILLTLMLFAMLFEGGFHIGKTEEPYLEDRTSGWEPRLDVLFYEDEDGTSRSYVNAAAASREELKETFGPVIGHGISAEAYPITPQDVFNAALGVKDEHGQGHPNSAAGGAFRVYYSEKSDAYFVTTNMFILGYAREDGSCILYERFGRQSGPGCFGSVVYGSDVSIQSE